MQLLHLIRPLLFLFLFLASRASAAPWVEDNDNHFGALPIHHPSADHQSYALRTIFPQLTWLRDTVIEKLFGVSPKNRHSRPELPAAVDIFASKAQLPPSLLARYGGDIVLRFNLTTADEEMALAEAADTLFLDVWEFTSNWADIRLREDDVPSLLGLLPKSLKKAHTNLMPDLARNIYHSYPHTSQPAASRNQPHHAFIPTLKKAGEIHNLFFNDFQPLSVILPWMRLMASMFTSHVRMIVIGKSYEGRDIHALRVGVSPAVLKEPHQPRKTILLTGGSHAREWVSVSTVTYIAWSLITSYGKLPAVTRLLEEFDFVFVPTINPDGYVYTWETDRLWRKNRQDTTLRFCRGLDLDRSFGFEWDGTTFQSNPCSESYPGDEPFQAVESRRLADWARNESDNNNVSFVGFLDFHSYSQQVLYPYSYSCSADPPSLENLEELGLGLAKAIRISSGEQYGVASACEGAVASKRAGKAVSSRMETGGGSAIDWFYHEMHVRYSYQVKLRDTGSYGFLLPKENIVPTGEEALDAVRYFGNFLLGNRGIESTEKTSYVEMGSIVSDADGDGVEEMPVVAETDLKENSVDWELRR